VIYPDATFELALDDPPTARYYEMTIGRQPNVYYRLADANGTTGAGSVRNEVGGGGTPNANAFFGIAGGPLSGDPLTVSQLGNGAGGAGQISTAGIAGTAGLGTVEFWFKRSTTGACQLAHAAFGTPTVSWYWVLDSTDRLIFSLTNLLTPSVTGPAVTDTNWHHFVWTANASSMYLDGVLVASGSDAPAVTGTGGLGSLIGGSSQITYFAEYAYYPANLTAGQVFAHYLSANTHTTPVYTGVSGYFMGGSNKRGRNYELDQIQGGTATERLNNQTRLFDPLNAAGSYYGKLKGMRRARLKWTISGNTYTRFAGYMRGWPQTRQGPTFATVDLSLVDGFEQLAQADISGMSPAFLSQLSGTVIGRVLDFALWPRSLRAIDTGWATTPVPTFTAGSFQSALDFIQQVAAGDLGYFFIDGAGVATFHDRYHRATTTAGATSQGTFGDSASGEALTYTDIVYDEESVDHILNDVTSTITGGTAQHADDGTSINTYFLRSQQRTPLTSTDADALVQSRLVVKTHATPGLRVDQITLVPSTTAMWTQVLSREIGDRITVKVNPVGGGAQIAVDCFVEAIQDDYSPGIWKSTWQLSPATATVSSWALDDPVYSLLDTTTALG
jgi:hypothetical protein